MGIARKLLEAACERLLKQGHSIIEAYPRIGVADEKENHFGPLSMYLSAGFREYREDDGRMVVRRM